MHGDTYNVVINIGEGCHHHHRHPLVLKKIGPFTEQYLPDHHPPHTGEVMNVEMSATQQVHVEYGAPIDKKGNPAKVQNVVWASSDESVVTVLVEDPEGNPFRALVKSATTLGVSEVTCTADADLGEGVKPISGEPIGFHTIAGEATALGAPTVGTPEEQPDAPPEPEPGLGETRRRR